MTGVVRERIVAQSLWAVVYGGRALSLAELSVKLAGVTDLAAHVRQLVDEGVLEADRHTWRIYGVRGITLAPTEHVLWLGRERRYARSLEVALGIMAELEESGRVETRCPECGRRLSLPISKGKVKRSVHSFGIVSSRRTIRMIRPTATEYKAAQASTTTWRARIHPLS